MKRFHIWPATDNGRSSMLRCCFLTFLGLVAVSIMAMASETSPDLVSPSPVPPPSLVVEEIELGGSGIYVYGEYKYIYDRANRFEGPTGYLFFGDMVVLGKIRNEKVDTPWGTMYWHGVHDHRALPEGWMPYPDYRAPLESFDF